MPSPNIYQVPGHSIRIEYDVSVLFLLLKWKKTDGGTGPTLLSAHFQKNSFPNQKQQQQHKDDDMEAEMTYHFNHIHFCNDRIGDTVYPPINNLYQWQ